MITRRRFLFGGAPAACTAGIGLYTWQWEPHWLELVERPLVVAGLPPQLAGARLVQLSDLHIGKRVDDSYLLRTFQCVRLIAPEIVVYTGDLVNHERDGFVHAQRTLARLPLGSRGTLAVLGNHDYGPGWSHPEIADRIAAIATSVGVRVLRNEAAVIDGLQIAGMDDLWAGKFEPRRALAGLDRTQASLVLSHNPDTADEPGWGDYAGWILSGHTHGGQCKPPFLPPPLLPVRNRRYTSGEFALSRGRRMYISRGVGHTLKVRFNARPEVTRFRLERASATQGNA